MGNSDVAADQIAVRGRKDMIFQNPEKAIKNILRGYQNFARRLVLIILSSLMLVPPIADNYPKFTVCIGTLPDVMANE